MEDKTTAEAWDILNRVKAPCEYSAAHNMSNVQATTVIDCGPVVGKVKACQECAELYERLSR